MSLLRIQSVAGRFYQLVTPLSAVQINNVRTKYRRPDTPNPDEELLSYRPAAEDGQGAREGRKHPESEKYPGEYAAQQPKGRVYDKKPIKIPLEADKRYNWCTCGYSKKQPFCDGSHKEREGTSLEKRIPKFRPLKFTVEESKDFYLCNCKQTNNAPFCDGTHKTLVE